jgi:hypothetical protein
MTSLRGKIDSSLNASSLRSFLPFILQSTDIDQGLSYHLPIHPSVPNAGPG